MNRLKKIKDKHQNFSMCDEYGRGVGEEDVDWMIEQIEKNQIINEQDRYERFKKEYEELCEKYQMSHATYDKWDSGHEEIVVYDEKEKKYILD